MAGQAITSSSRGASGTALPSSLPQPLLGHLRRTADRPVEGTALVALARRTARDLLDPSGDRWRHTVGVASRAASARSAVPVGQDAVLVAAAWLHDVGYAPALRRTGFHPLDGAWHLRETGWPEPVAALVAHHSGARFLAAEQGLAHHLDDFPDRRGWSGPLADALLWADQTTSPCGRRVSLEDRLAEARARHGDDSPLARAHALRAPDARAAAAATEHRLGRRLGRGVPTAGSVEEPFDVRG